MVQDMMVNAGCRGEGRSGLYGHDGARERLGCLGHDGAGHDGAEHDGAEHDGAEHDGAVQGTINAVQGSV